MEAVTQDDGQGNQEKPQCITYASRVYAVHDKAKAVGSQCRGCKQDHCRDQADGTQYKHDPFSDHSPTPSFPPLCRLWSVIFFISLINLLL